VSEREAATRGEPGFAAFVVEYGPRLQRALIARFGGERGREATAEALGFAWETWPRASTFSNPVAYLFTVGRSRTRRLFRSTPTFAAPVGDGRDQDPPEPALAGALARLSPRQRTAFVLIDGYDWQYREVAELLGVSIGSVQRHRDRALRSLRKQMGVEDL
jgi:DNA-directed RNA polymerase specialized sigma24 family protein